MEQSEVIITWDNDATRHSEYNIYRSLNPIDINAPGTPLTTLSPSIGTYTDNTVKQFTTYYYRVEGVRADNGGSEFGIEQRTDIFPSLYISYGSRTFKAFPGGGIGFEIDDLPTNSDFSTVNDISAEHTLVVAFYDSVARGITLNRYDKNGVSIDQHKINNVRNSNPNDIMVIDDDNAICTFTENGVAKAIHVEFSTSTYNVIDTSGLDDHEKISQLKVTYVGDVVGIAHSPDWTDGATNTGVPVIFSDYFGSWDVKPFVSNPPTTSFIEDIVLTNKIGNGFIFAPTSDGKLAVAVNDVTRAIKVIDRDGNAETVDYATLNIVGEVGQLVASNHKAFDLIVSEVGGTDNGDAKTRFLDGDYNVANTINFPSPLVEGMAIDNLAVYTIDRNDVNSGIVLLDVSYEDYTYSEVDLSTDTVTINASTNWTYKESWTGDGQVEYNLLEIVDRDVASKNASWSFNMGKYNYI